MKLKFKIPIICAVAALALSFILGLISGVRFSSILIRSFIISLISGGFVLGAQILLEHFVPDLFQPLVVQETEKQKSGKNLNISIDEPIEVSYSDDEERLNEGEPISKYDMLQETSGAEEDKDFDLEQSEIIDDELGTQSGLSDKDDVPIDEDFPDVNTKAVNTKKEVKEPVKELEELPDLQSFIPEDELNQDNDQMDFTERGTGAFDVSTDIAGSGMDTNTMVSAIRTVLKRDS